MARITVVVVAFIGIVLAQGNPSSQTSCKCPVNPIWARLVGNTGTWWGYLTEDQKDMFIDGYLLAMNHASSTLHSVSDMQMKEVQPGDKEFNAKFFAAANLRYISEKFSFKLGKPLKPALDD